MARITRQAMPSAEPAHLPRSTPPLGLAEAGGAIQERELELSCGRVAISETAGSGTPLLFIHGNSSAKDVFDLQLRSPLGQSRRCIALDLPGHGASGKAHEPSETYSISGFADAAIETLEALDIDQVVLVGWSLGGHVALEMVASFPGVVGAMVVAAPPVRSGVRGLISGFKLSSATPMLGSKELSESQAASLAQTLVGADHAAAAAEAILKTDGRSRELMFRSMFRGRHADQRRTVETSQAVIAMVNGDDDPIIRARAVNGPRYANLWGGVCHWIPGGGHAPFLAAAPLFNHLLGRFAQDMELRAEQMRETPQLMYSG